MNKGLFLDRDGVINLERGDYTWRIEDFVLIPETIELARKAIEAGFKIIVITNQGGIDLGLYIHEHVLDIHANMIKYFRREGVEITEIFYCSHHHKVSKCFCRKPESLFFERALAKYNFDPALSFMVGDRDRDLEPAKILNMNTIMIGDSDTTHADYRFATTGQLLNNFNVLLRDK